MAQEFPALSAAIHQRDVLECSSQYMMPPKWNNTNISQLTGAYFYTMDAIALDMNDSRDNSKQMQPDRKEYKPHDSVFVKVKVGKTTIVYSLKEEARGGKNMI
jgi:hypothetical protein